MNLNILKGVLLIGVLLAGTSVYSQGVDVTAENLVGSWTFEQGPSFARMTPEDKEILDADAELKTRVFTGYVNRVLNFNSDGTFSQIDGFAKQVKGSWNLQDQTLTILDPNGNQWVQVVSAISGNKLVLEQLPRGDGQPILPELHFLRIQ